MALDFPTSPVEGQVHGTYVFTSGVWNAQGSTNNVGIQIAQLQATIPGTPGVPYRSAAGTVNVGGTAVVITFPVGRFTSAPIINFTAGWVLSNGATPAGWPVVPYASAPTTSAVSVVMTNSSSITNLWWTAVQMTPTSGAG